METVGTKTVLQSSEAMLVRLALEQLQGHRREIAQMMQQANAMFDKAVAPILEAHGLDAGAQMTFRADGGVVVMVSPDYAEIGTTEEAGASEATATTE